ncbi:CheR family methyltransferase [Paludibacterium yongneupense]|uniref:CheR family methyltransferase n=1 Tax=Paludibacterium yongneupense TaxID=400061 RepID=UPI0003FE00DA|nr:CheR family methyltransferase [Paludibacterium yongneupense]
MGRVLSPERDLRFDGEDFRRIQALVYRHAGIALNDSKANMVYARLARRVRAHSLEDFGSYLSRLEGNSSDPEWEYFINALTTNLTAFFREAHHFDALAEHIGQHGDAQPYRVWCAAASTGEEPYSIAMTLLESRAAGSFEVLASDIDTHVLDTAALGVYPLERVSALPEAKLKRYFQRGTGDKSGLVRIKSELREAIRFCQINLIASNWPQIGLFHAIFCRNVMIYFDKPTQNRILTSLGRHLEPDGRLFLGHSENIQLQTDAFIPCGRTIYRMAGR